MTKRVKTVLAATLALLGVMIACYSPVRIFIAYRRAPIIKSSLLGYPEYRELFVGGSTSAGGTIIVSGYV